MKDLDLRVGGRYKLICKLGEGTFGLVYKGVDVNTNEQFAIKLEHVSMEISMLDNERIAYRELSAGFCVPKVYWYGYECEYKAMVMDLLGPSLEDLFNYCGGKFSLKTVLMLADQLISRLEFMHSKGVIHRDIKPSNVLMGLGRSGNHLYIIDPGLAMSEECLMPSKSHCFMGTEEFASINGHLGNKQSPADDLQSLGYALVYFCLGSLPWSDIKNNSKEDRQRIILDMKQSMNSEMLCKDLPKEFAIYLNEVNTGEASYRRLRKLFRGLFVRSGFKYDNVFDWTILLYLATKDAPSRG